VHEAEYGTDKIAQELMTGNLDGRKFLRQLEVVERIILLMT